MAWGGKIVSRGKVGRNVGVGGGWVVGAPSGVAGGTGLRECVAVAAQGGVSGHLEVATGAQIGAQSGVMRDVPAGVAVLGSPARPAREFFRLCALWDRELKTRGRKKDE